MLVVLGLEKDSHWWKTWFYFVKEGSGNTAVCACNSLWFLSLQGGGWRRLCHVFSLSVSPALWFGDLRTKSVGYFRGRDENSLACFIFSLYE